MNHDGMASEHGGIDNEAIPSESHVASRGCHKKSSYQSVGTIPGGLEVVPG